LELLVVVNAVADVAPDQTTALLAWRAARRGWSVRLVGVDGLGLDHQDRVVARARRLKGARSTEASLRGAVAGTVEDVDLDDVDAVLVRTNPARRGASPLLHATALELLRVARDRGTLVLNDPDTLLRASSKLYLTTVPPPWRPPMCVSADPAVLLRFVHARPGRTVLKPLQGTRGRDVFFVEGPTTPNLAQLADVLVRDGPALAQAWIEGGEQGDTRVLLLDGEPLRADGRLAAVRRIPRPGELRSNVAQGGRAARANGAAQALEVAAALGPRLRDDGVFLAGLDVIGRQVVEVNVLAPGGLVDAERLEGVDFSEVVLDALAARAGSLSPRTDLRSP
jgi:glutathione synthase